MEGLRCAVGLIVITLLLQGLFVPVHCKNDTASSSSSSNNSSSSSSDTEPVVLLGKSNVTSSEPETPQPTDPIPTTIPPEAIINSTDTNATVPVKTSANSAEVEKAAPTSAAVFLTAEKGDNITKAAADTSAEELENLSGNSTTSEASKKDKRQAQRGYTDIPIDEGPFQDLANSSPSSSLANFESDLPPLAENLNNDLPSSYPASLNINRDPDSSFFARRVGLPDPIIPPQDYAKRVGLLSHHQDNIAAAAVPLQERVDADDNNCGDACDGKPIPGEAGTDYPVLAKIPKTSFSCKSQQWPGYYADTEARCQVFWICQKHRMDAFLCPNGTLFNQQVFVCDWWFNVDCNASPEFYSRNQYLYAGPGIGIDGKPTRFRGGTPALPSSSNSVLSIPPRPSGVNSNAFVNQVQSTNQIARVATVSSGSVPLSSSSSQPISQQQPLRNTNSYYESSSSNNQQQKYLQSNSNSNQQQQQQKYQSVQNMLSSRMQKGHNNNQQQQNPTGKPLQASSSNQVLGGYQTNQLSLNSQSELDRRSFSSQPPPVQQQQQQHSQSQSTGGGGRGASYEGNHHNRVSSSTTGRPESYNSPSPSSPRPPSPSPTPQINVNIDTSKTQKQTLSSFSSNNFNNNNGGRSISSTGRPFIQVNSDVPLFAPGSSSSTARPPTVGSSTRNPLNNFASSSVNLIGSSQNINNSSILRTPVSSTLRPPPAPSSTRAPPPPSRDYIPNLNPPPKPTSPSPAAFISSSTGRPKEYIPPLSNHNSNSNNNRQHSQPHASNSLPHSNNNNYIPPESTTPLSTSYGAPGHTPGTPQASSSPSPKGFHTFGSREFVGFHGQRSNQFSNVNGQREIMYSPSASNIYAEFPYSPSQQKNKQRLLELQNAKGISSSNKDIFSYPHFHGQRSNAFSDGDSVSYIQNNNKKVNINHGGYSQRTNPFTNHLQPSNPNSVHGVPTKDSHQQQQHPSPSSPAPLQHTQQPFQHQSQNQPIHHQQPIIHSLTGPSSTPQPHHQQQHQSQPSQSQNVQQYHVQVQPTPQPKSFQSNPPQQHFHQQNPQQQQFTQNQPQPQPSIQHYSQQTPQQHPNHNHVQQSHPHHLPYATPSPTPPFHQRIATIPSQNLELPSLAHGPLQLNPQQQQQQPTFTSHPDGYTSLTSGSYISIATSPSPFSKQILKHSVFQGGEPQQHQKISHKNYKQANGPAFVSTALPIVSNHNDFHVNQGGPFISSTGQPYLQNHASPHHVSVSLSTTLRPPSIHSSAAPFTNQPTAYPSQNTYIAAPTVSPVQSTSPGHRQNPYLPHNHGKKSGKNSGHQPQYPNSVISTTINYPEGTGSLKVLQGSQGTSGRRNLVDFSYKANPTSSTPYPSSTTRFPSGKERFNNGGSSTTGRPQQPYKAEGSIRKGSRLAGAVINKSTSSSSAIYVDNADTAESVSTPVSVVSPSASPAVATANYGLRISSTAKKRMAGAWQNYFSGNDKENSTVVAVANNEEDA